MLLIRGGTVVTAEHAFRADVRCVEGKIAEIGPELDVGAATVVDASDALVMPGGIDPHTHMELPFMGGRTGDDFFTGPAAGLAGGTTMIIDFVIPAPDERPLDAFRTWRKRAEKAPSDYAFHVAITSWSDQVSEDMGTLARDHGVNSFKHFMSYKGNVMLSDEGLVPSFARCRELGAIATVHGENGDLIQRLQQELLQRGITGPEGHPQAQPPAVEGEATNRAIRIAEVLGTPLYVVHVTCRESLEAVTRARLAGQRVWAEVLTQHLVIDESVYYQDDPVAARAFVMSPPFRSADHQEDLWRGLQSGMLDTTATDHCAFCNVEKDKGAHDFTRIPNGTSGIEERLAILWHDGVEAGRLTPSEFVALTSTNCARIFNLYPQKGSVSVGADADLVVWDANATQTIRNATQHQANDFNIYEGMTLTGLARATVSQGELCWDGDTLRATQGKGRYIPRETFPSVFDAVDRLERHQPARGGS